jgi:hypothetical protein
MNDEIYVEMAEWGAITFELSDRDQWPHYD